MEGMDRVMKKLNQETTAIKGRTLHGMIRAAIIVRRDMDHGVPKVPVDTGNLWSSFFVVTSKGNVEQGQSPSFKDDDNGKMSTNHSAVINKVKGTILNSKTPVVVMGFTANYAMWTHELIGRKYQRQGAGPRYFQASIRRNMPAMLKVIRDTAKI